MLFDWFATFLKLCNANLLRDAISFLIIIYQAFKLLWQYGKITIWMEVSKYKLAIWEFDNRAVRHYMALHYILGMLEYCRNTEYGNMAK